MTGRWEEVAGRVLGAALRFDERMVNGVDPPPLGSVDVATLSWAPAVEARWGDMRRELDALVDAGVTLPDTDDLVGHDQGTEGRWTTYVLHWYGRTVSANAVRCPVTTETVEAVPGLQIAGLTVLGAHSHLPRHKGPAKSLRYQLGLRIPGPPGACRLQVGDDVLIWRDGRSLAFDDRTEHEAWNDAHEARYVLFVQVRWPVPGVRGRVHGAVGQAFGRATRRIPERATALDGALNAGVAE